MERGVKLGLGIAVVLGLIVALPLYLLTGSVSPSSIVQPTAPSTDEVVRAFEEEGLGVSNPRDVEDDPEWGTGMLPKTMDSGTRFEIPGYDRLDEPAVGDVYHFATAEDQRVLSDYLETVASSSGLFYTHVYETDGFLLKIDGSVPKNVADSYGEVFENVA